ALGPLTGFPGGGRGGARRRATALRAEEEAIVARRILAREQRLRGGAERRQVDPQRGDELGELRQTVGGGLLRAHRRARLAVVLAGEALVDAGADRLAGRARRFDGACADRYAGAAVGVGGARPEAGAGRAVLAELLAGAGEEHVRRQR